jgi:hypothetical protein
MRFPRLVPLLPLLSVIGGAQSPEAVFEKSVRPLLISKCSGCHAGAAPAGGLSLDSRAALLKGGGRGPAVVPGNAAESLLLRAVRHSEGNLRMPPGPKLTDAEILPIAQWIDAGAPWGQAAAPPQTQKYWSFIPPSDPVVPQVRFKAWVQNPIDAFVLARLEEKGLQPAPPADKRTLIRRATYDLTGLPPTTAEVDAFLRDDSPDAYRKLIERLLASPRYGERWGRHWLDVARYADSNGLDENLVYRNAWRYRDYVIAAFNKDKPYDRFIQEQLAGDLLPDTGNLPVQLERWTATGFLSLGAKMLAEDDPVKMEMDIIDEQVDTMGKAFMGLTIGCARCHDHKFDPIPQADYYAIAGIFKSTHTMDHFKVVAKWHEHVLAPKEQRERLAAHEASIEAKAKEIGNIVKAENKKLTDAAKTKIGAYLLAVHELRQTRIALRPSPGPSIVERAADSHHASNVEKPLTRKKTNVPKDGKGPFFAEYIVDVPAAGEYQIDVFEEEKGYGTPDLRINGVLVKGGEPPVENREASPDAGGWDPLGIFPLPSGKVTLRFQHKSRFPYFERFRITANPLPASTPIPRTAEQIAARHGVNPAFLDQLNEHLDRSSGAPASVLYAFEHFGETRPAGEWTSPAAKLFEGFQPANLQQLAERYQELFLASLAKREQKDAALDALQELLTEKFGPFAAPANARDDYPPAVLTAIGKLEEERKQLEAAKPDLPHAMGVRDHDRITDLPIHIRGSHWTLGDVVKRGFLRSISVSQPPAVPASASGRLQFAEWLTRKDHPLTARVMVNRLWRWHFGKGIVPSTDNFGRLGERPTNQPLLDWLAVRFIEQGWSMKQMHALIMQSNSYRMSSRYDAAANESDPENTLLWRFPRLRLDAESIRDAIMSVSGGLDVEHAGGSILSYKDRQYVANTSKRGGVDYDRNLRAVYIPVVRSSMYELFSAFDLPDPAVPQGDRDSTIVAPQALFMLNGSVVLGHSRTMAQSLLQMAGNDTDRIRAAYERSFSRPPSNREIDQALTFLSTMERKAEGPDKRLLAWQSLCKALIASNEFIYLN